MFAVLIGLPAPQRWKFLALALGLTVLLLTKTRSAWAAFLIGALVLQLRQPLRALPRQWIALAVVLLLAAPAITHPRVHEGRVGPRGVALEDRGGPQLSRAEADHELRRRAAQAESGRRRARPARRRGQAAGRNGRKVSVIALDSGLLEVFSVMGWMGGALFTLALFGILIPIVRERRARRDAVTNGAAAAVVALLTASFFGNVFNGVAGVMFWSAVGLATAGRTYALALEQARRYSVQPGVPLRPALARYFPAA